MNNKGCIVFTKALTARMELRAQSSDSCPLKMLATETGETLGRTTFRTRPKSPKNPPQPKDALFWGSLPIMDVMSAQLGNGERMA